MALVEEVVQEYKTSLLDLNVNSKPLINMLTMLADDNEQHAPHIVKVIEDHITKCRPEKKLPVLYLIDSIMKNLPKSSYKSLFCKNIVQTFTSVFEKVGEKVRASMYKLRQTWTEIVPLQKLYMVDVQIHNLMDPAWPITAPPPEQTSIHVNPKFLAKASDGEHSSPEMVIEDEEVQEPEEDLEEQEEILRQQLISKQQELLKIKQASLELELAETEERMRQKKKQSTKSSAPTGPKHHVSPKSTVEVPAAPRDPRLAAGTVANRDPRLARSAASAINTPLGNTPVNPSLSAFPSSLSTSSTHTGFVQEGYGSQPHTSQIPQYNGIPVQPGMNVPFVGQGDVFTGEVFNSPESFAMFSEDDSESSVSSWQEVVNNPPPHSNIPPPHSKKQSVINTRDPRYKKREPEESHKGPQMARHHHSDTSRQYHHTSSKQHAASSKHHPEPHKHHAEISKSHHTNAGHQDHRSYRHSSDTKEHERNSKERDRNSKDKDRVSKDRTSVSPRQGSSHNSTYKSASSQNISKQGGSSKDKDVKSAESVRERDTRHKTSVVNEKKKSNDSNSRSTRSSKLSPKSDLNEKRKTSKSPEIRAEKVPRKSSSSTSQRSDKDTSKDKKSKRSEDVKKKDSKTSLKDSSRHEVEQTKIKKEPIEVKKNEREVDMAEERMDTDELTSPNMHGDKGAKRASEKGTTPRAIKKLKMEPGLENDNNNSTNETVVKMETADRRDSVSNDISDLFGCEDQDYRSAEQKGLPLKSPSSKGWDSFKAQHSDTFAHDIQLKKQREELEQKRREDEPQDTDYRMTTRRQSSASSDDAAISSEFIQDQHAEILLTAHKQLQDGVITHDQHQEIIKGLGELMQIQKLQRQSELIALGQDSAAGQDLAAGQDHSALDEPVVDNNIDLRNKSQEQQTAPRENLPPDRPLERFKIPRLREREGSPRKGSADARGELQNLYPDRPVREPEPPRPDPRERKAPLRLDRGEPVDVEKEWEPVSPDKARQGESGWRGQSINIDRREELDRQVPQREASLPVAHQELGRRGPPGENIRRGPSGEFEDRGPPGMYDRRLPSGPSRELNRKGSPDFMNKRPPGEGRRGRSAEFDSQVPPVNAEEWALPPEEFSEEGPGSEYMRRGPPNRRGPPEEGPGSEDMRRGPLNRRGPPEEGPGSEDMRRGPPNRRGPPEEGPGSEDMRRGPPNRRGPPEEGPGSEDMRRGPPNRRGPPEEGPGSEDMRRGPPNRRGPPEEGPGFEDMRRGPPNRRGPPGDFNRRGPPGDFDGRMPPEERNRRGAPGDFDGRTPPEEHNRRGPPGEFDGRMPLEEHNRRGPPGEFDGRMPPEEHNRRGPPGEFDGRMPLEEHNRRGPPGDFDGRMPPEEHNRRGPPGEFDGRMPLEEHNRRGPPGDLDGRMPQEERNRRGPPAGPHSGPQGRFQRGAREFEHLPEGHRHPRDRVPPDEFTQEHQEWVHDGGPQPEDRWRDPNTGEPHGPAMRHREHLEEEKWTGSPREDFPHGPDEGRPHRRPGPPQLNQGPRGSPMPSMEGPGPFDPRSPHQDQFSGPQGSPFAEVPNEQEEVVKQELRDNSGPDNGRPHHRPEPRQINQGSRGPPMPPMEGPGPFDPRSPHQDQFSGPQGSPFAEFPEDQEEAVKQKLRDNSHKPKQNVKSEKPKFDPDRGLPPWKPVGKKDNGPAAHRKKRNKDVKAEAESFENEPPFQGVPHGQPGFDGPQAVHEGPGPFTGPPSSGPPRFEGPPKGGPPRIRAPGPHEPQVPVPSHGPHEPLGPHGRPGPPDRHEPLGPHGRPGPPDRHEPLGPHGRPGPPTRHEPLGPHGRPSPPPHEPLGPNGRPGPPVRHEPLGPHGRPGPPLPGHNEFPPVSDHERPPQGGAPVPPPVNTIADKENMSRSHTEHLPAFLGPANPKPSGRFRGEEHAHIRGKRFSNPRHEKPRMSAPIQSSGPSMPRPLLDLDLSARPRGPVFAERQNMPRGPHPPVEAYVDKNGDPRFRSFVDMGPEVSEEVVLGKRNYEIKLGAPPRRIQWGTENIEVYADPSKRGVVVDGVLMYKFGERVKEVVIRGRKEKIFYHGKPLTLWIDGQSYEVRVDSPPKAIFINNKPHRVQIDGRDMMILIDKEEKGKFGGEPRFVFIDSERMEIRFDPPPGHILIDGKPCELKLNLPQPCVNIDGKLHGIRFDGSPRDVFINSNLYQIHTDHAIKLRVGNRFHYVALGGPCHELIVDGKWFEMKFNTPPKEVSVGNTILMVQLPGSPPEVKILPELPPPLNMPMPGPNFLPVPGSMPGMMPSPSMPVTMVPVPMTAHMAIPGMAVPVSNPPSALPSSLSNLFTSGPPPSQPGSAPPLDINSLLARLKSSGILPKDQTPPRPPATKAPAPTATDKGKEQDKEAESGPSLEFATIRKKNESKDEKFDDIPDMTELALNEMKKMSWGSIQRMYAGVQCNSCGTRFRLDDDEKTEKYRQHLDWHFRQNKRDKDDIRVVRCRKWYYGINDWLQYEELGDTEEQAKSSLFEMQQQQQQESSPSQPHLPLLTVPEGSTVQRCPPATGNENEDLCDICHEPFEQYWDEEHEHWHLRDAIQVNTKNYHPICYEDYTDVSEGTPSPSVLNSMEPNFSGRKTNYDECSQDGLPHSSFEEERGAVSVETTKTETPTTSTSDTGIAVKLEPVFESMKKAEDNQEAMDVDPVPADTAVDSAVTVDTVKTEPMSVDPSESDSVSLSTSSDSVPVKTEPMEAEPAIKEVPTDTVPVTEFPIKIEDSSSYESTGLLPGLDIKPESTGVLPGLDIKPESNGVLPGLDFKPESTGVLPGLDIKPESTGVLPGLDIQPESTGVLPGLDIQPDPGVLPGVEIKPESTDALPGLDIKPESTGVLPGLDIKPDPEIKSEPELEPVTSTECDHPLELKEEIKDDEPENTVEVKQEQDLAPMETTDVKEDEAEEADKEEQLAVLTEAIINVADESVVNAMTVTHNIDSTIKEESYQGAENLENVPELESMPNVSLFTPLTSLSRVKLCAPSTIVEVSPDVLEIGSNASTPTRDELPSPPAEDY